MKIMQNPKNSISDYKIYPQIVSLPEQIELAMNYLSFDIRKTSKAIVCGMGTCSIAGMFVSDYLDTMHNSSLYVAKGIELPKWVDKDTTVIVISYTGDTEETVHLYRSAVRTGAQIVCITTGGELQELCLADDNILLSPPGGFVSRGSIGYMIGFILFVLHNIGMLDARAEISDALGELKSFRDKIISDDDNEAFRIANAIKGKVPSIYGFFNMKSVSYRWKAQLNENSRLLCFHGTLPEFNHNELMGWVNDQMINDYLPVVLFDDGVSKMLKAMAETPMGMIMSRGMSVYIYHVKGKNHLVKMLETLLVGDLVSLYLAKAIGVEPRDNNRLKLGQTDKSAAKK